MSQPPTLTEPHLIRSVQEAVRERRLGIQRGARTSRFIHEDGSVCAVASALPPVVLGSILANGDERYSWLALTRAGYFGPADLRSIEGLATFQLGYDFCFKQEGGVDEALSDRFCKWVLSLDPTSPPAIWPSEMDEPGIFRCSKDLPSVSHEIQVGPSS